MAGAKSRLVHAMLPPKKYYVLSWFCIVGFYLCIALDPEIYLFLGLSILSLILQFYT